MDDIYKDITSGMSLPRLYRKYGGTSLYIGRTVGGYKEKIIKEFDGGNHAYLAHKYNTSVKTVYTIIREYRGGTIKLS